jgi:uncharacterized membrane protein YgcG
MMARVALALLLWLGLAFPVFAEELIDRYISTITVNKDGSLDVVEDITVLSEQKTIRRGILRDFPTRYQVADGTSLSVGFEVLDVKHNGEETEWRLESVDNGVRIRIGRADRLLAAGYHTFSIRYKTTRQIGFFKDYDELYFNITGNGWTFPINDVFVSVTLPEGAVIKPAYVFTGPFGTDTGQASVRTAERNTYQANTTSLLARGHGLTVALAWQKGIVNPPSSSQSTVWWLKDNSGYGLLAGTLAAVLCYFGLAWNRVGRDPPKGNIIPLFKPPVGLGPAAARYIWRKSHDNQGFSAALVDLAVKGRVKIDDVENIYSLSKLENHGPELTKSEAALYDALPDGKLALENKNHRVVARAKDALQDHLETEYQGRVFVKNFGWFFLGALLSAAGLVASGLLIPGKEGETVLFAGIFAAVWWGVLLAVAYSALTRSRSSGFLSVVGLVFRLLFLVPFALAGLAVPLAAITASGTNPAMLAFLAMAVVLGVVNLVFYRLLPAPTVDGRKLLDQIEGFRMYLATAEEKRLDALHPPDKTPELFERYLPYAMALDCENEWNKKFTAVLTAAAAAGATAPVWYSSTRAGGWNLGGFASGLNSSLSSSISSASTPPGSTSGTGRRSGGGGGGFSGGGGGGGGGSGW